MTAFSYLFGYLVRENTKEPDLLGKLVHRLFPGTTRMQSKIAGWTAHYLVGLLFVELYARWWERSSIRANRKTGLVFGGMSGLAAILIWKFTLAAHPFPPAINFKKFAANLLFAHLVFGLVAVIAYNE